VLAPLGGKPMIQWVYEAALKSRSLDRVMIAVDDEKVMEAVKRFGGECCMTSSLHKSGTDRLKEVSEFLPGYGMLINIQGDEPGIEPELIDGVADLLKSDFSLDAATAARPFRGDEDHTVPDRVKVVFTKKLRALYFSRSPIPYVRKSAGFIHYLHLGIYAYRRDFLHRFSLLPDSLLEQTESLEQLRILENDHSMGVFLCEDSLPGVDTPEDLKYIESVFKKKGII